MFTGDTVFVGGAATTPIEVLCSMADHGKQKQLKDVRVCSIHLEFDSPYSTPEYEGAQIIYLEFIKYISMLSINMVKIKKI